MVLGYGAKTIGGRGSSAAAVCSAEGVLGLGTGARVGGWGPPKQKVTTDLICEHLEAHRCGSSVVDSSEGESDFIYLIFDLFYHHLNSPLLSAPPLRPTCPCLCACECVFA